MQLIIGNKNYSSWSMRPWVLMRALDIPFEERKLRFDFGDLVRGQEHPADRRDRTLFPRGARRDPFAIYKRAFACAGVAQPVLERVIEPSADGAATIGKRDNDAERFFALGEIGGPVERVDNPARARQLIEHVPISGDGFLAHHRNAGGELGERVSEEILDFAVDHGNRIVHPLHLNLARPERAITRQHRPLRCKPEQVADFRVEGAEFAHERPITNDSRR